MKSIAPLDVILRGEQCEFDFNEFSYRMTCLSLQLTLVVIPKFDFESFLKSIVAYKVTHLL